MYDIGVENIWTKWKERKCGMKRIVAIVVLLMMIVIFGCNQVYAAENIIDQQNESQLIKIKENSATNAAVYLRKEPLS